MPRVDLGKSRSIQFYFQYSCYLFVNPEKVQCLKFKLSHDEISSTHFLKKCLAGFDYEISLYDTKSKLSKLDFL